MLVIFDCDGVLVDSEPLSNAALACTLAGYGLPLSVAQTTAEFKGRSWASCARRIEEMLGRSVPAGLREDYAARRDAAFRSSLRAVPGVIEALDALDGVAHCVASSGDHGKMRLTLGLTGLLERFPHRFSATEVEHGKPAPDLFLHAASSMGAAPADCVVVEDSSVGVAAARAAGMRVLGFGVDGGDAAFTDMAELPALVSAAASLGRG